MNEGVEGLSSFGKLIGDYITAVQCFDEKSIHKSLRVLRSAVTTSIAPEAVFSEEETEHIFGPLYKFVLDVDPRRGHESRRHLQSGGGTAVSPPSSSSSSSSPSTRSPSHVDRDTKGGNATPSSPALPDEIQNRIWSGIGSAFSDKHVVLGSAYHSLSLQILSQLLAKTSTSASFPGGGRLQEAIEYAGRALLVALNAHGMVSDSTAERHCHLGGLYVRAGQYDLARKQLSVGKEIYRRMYGSVSLEVAQCDSDLAHVEEAAGRQRRAYAYNAWYDCYRARSLLLGAADSSELTKEALDQLLHARQLENLPGTGTGAGAETSTSTSTTTTTGDICMSAFELLQAVDNLHWERQAAKSPRFQVSIFVHQLIASQQSRDHRADACALSASKVAQLVASAVRFAHSHIGTGASAGLETRKAPQSSPTHLYSIAGGGGGGVGGGAGGGASPASPSTAGAIADAHLQQEVSQIVEELLRACRGSAALVLVPPLNRTYDYIAPTRQAQQQRQQQASHSPFSSSPKARSHASSSSSSPLFRSPSFKRVSSPGAGVGVDSAANGSPGSGSSNNDDVQLQRKAQRKGALSEAGSPFYKGKELAQLRTATVTATGSNHFQPQSVEAGMRGRPLLADSRPASERMGQLRAGGMPEAKNTTGRLSLDLLTLAMMTPTVVSAASPPADAEAGYASGARPKSVRFPASAEAATSLSASEARPKSVRMLSPTASSASPVQSPEGSRSTAAAVQRDVQRDVEPITQRTREELHRAAAQLTSTGVEGVEEAQVPFSLGGRLSVLARDADNNAVVVTSLLAAANAVKAGKMTFAMATQTTPASASSSKAADGDSGSGSSNPPEMTALRRASETVRRMSKKVLSTAAEKEEEEAQAASSAQSASSAIPVPPPLPSAWPPVPYKGPRISIEEALLFGKPAAAATAAAAAANGAGAGAGVNDTKVAASGPAAAPMVGAFAAAKAAAAASAKGAKKIELSPLLPLLPSHPGGADDHFLKGTLWELPVPEHVPLADLFDDIEEEFLKLPEKKNDAAKGKAKGAGAGKAAGVGGAKSAKPGHDTGSSADAAATKAAESVLDPRRNQNLSIMLTKFGKRTPEDIAKSVCDFDCEAVGIAALQTLSENIPAAEEYKAVKTLIATLVAKQVEADKAQAAHDEEFASAAAAVAVTAVTSATGPSGAAQTLALSRIGKAEKYIFHLGAIPSLEGRLQSMLQCLTSVEAGEVCHRAGEAVNIATSEVLDSDRLRYFLNLVLRMANVVNSRSIAALHADTKKIPAQSSSSSSQIGKGGADAAVTGGGGPIRGFKLSEISNLAKTKTNSGDTADVYLVYKIYTNLPQALDIGADLAQIDAAKDVNFPRIRADVAKLTEGVAALERLIAADMKKPAQEEGTGRALILMNQRLAESKALAATCVKELKEAEADFSRVCTYLGEDPAKSTPASVFGALKRLVLTVQEATRAAQDKVAKAERLARRQGGAGAGKA